MTIDTFWNGNPITIESYHGEVKVFFFSGDNPDPVSWYRFANLRSPTPNPGFANLSPEFKNFVRDMLR